MIPSGTDPEETKDGLRAGHSRILYFYPHTTAKSAAQSDVLRVMQ